MDALSDAERQRRRRYRQREGIRVIRMDVYPDIVALLISRGWLDMDEANDPEKLAYAIEDFVDCAARGTLKVGS